MFCAYHLEKNCIKDPLHMKNIDLKEIDPKRFPMKCLVCNTRDGACIQCQHRRCPASFHPECAKDLFVNTRDKTGYDEVCLYCALHKPLNLRRLIDSKEKRAAEDIFTFCRAIERLIRKRDKTGKSSKKKRPVSGPTFTYKDKYNLFDAIDNYVEEIAKTQENEFAVYVKQNSAFSKLRSKIDVTRPIRYNLIDPIAIFSKHIKLPRKNKEEFYQYYLDFVYPVMKQELATLKLPSVTFKPKTKGKKRKSLKFGRKKFKRMLEPTVPIINEYDDISTIQTYCICKQPFVECAAALPYESAEEFDERTRKNKMIGCDGDCGEWFHLECLNLPFDFEEDPWYCPQCGPMIIQPLNS